MPAPADLVRVERIGLQTVPARLRGGTPAALFWPWFGATFSILGVAFGAFTLDFGLSVGQALLAGAVGMVASCLVCGVVAVAGPRGSAPTLVASRVTFGTVGNRVPAALCWLLTLGWDVVVTVVAVLATATLGRRLGLDGDGGTLLTAGALLVVVALVVGGGVLGYRAVVALQRWLSLTGIVLTLAFAVVTAPRAHWVALPAGPTSGVVGATVLVMTVGGLGWVNAAADYSRYLPRHTSAAAVAGWTTVGLAAAPLLLTSYGVLLAAGDPSLRAALGRDPVGALAALLPTWFLVPFAVVTVLGQVGAALLGLYSSGLALLAVGVPLTRPRAALLDGVLLVLTTSYVVFGAALGGTSDLLDPFRAFLVTLGVPVAAWAGLMVAEVLGRRTDDVAPAGVRWPAVLVLLAGSAVGLGLVTSPGTGWLGWQGYLLGPVGGRGGAWAGAGLGVLAALGVGAVGGWLTRSSTVSRRQRDAVRVEA